MNARRCAACLLALIAALAACDADPSEQIQAGNALLMRAEYRAAAVAYQVAQAVSPDEPDAYFNAGIALALSGQFAQAEEAFRMALRVDTGQLAQAIYYNLGNVYFDQRRFEAAVVAYQQALLLNPGDADARYNLELALRRLSPVMTSTSEAESSAQAMPSAEIQEEQPSTPTPDASTPTSSPSNSQQALDAPDQETAERILDALQAQQRSWGEQLQRLATPAPDWGNAW